MLLYLEITDVNFYEKNKFNVIVKSDRYDSLAINIYTLNKQEYFTKSGKLKERKLKEYIKNQLNFTCNIKLSII